jgi:ketosteroid isomerase-like protein
MEETEYKQILKQMKDTQAKYEQRLKVMEDIQAIQDLHREYVYWLNLCDWDKVIDIFTEDCSADIGRWGIRHGKESLQKLFKEDIGHNNRGAGRDGHFVTMPVISVDGDKANGHWLFYIMMTDHEKGNRWLQGRHEVDYLKIDGKWKIRNIWFGPWPPQDPEEIRKIFAGKKGE